MSAHAMPLVHATIDSPVGPLLVAGTAEAVHVVAFVSGARARQADPAWMPDVSGVLRPMRDELDAYFTGRLRAFTVPLAPAGTPFQQRVWAELCRIPYGETISYQELARRIDQPKAVRAVGLANGANPMAIVVPCHRVIGANGSLTGYGGGIGIKKALLDLESGEQSLL